MQQALLIDQQAREEHIRNSDDGVRAPSASARTIVRERIDALKAAAAYGPVTQAGAAARAAAASPAGTGAGSQPTTTATTATTGSTSATSDGTKIPENVVLIPEVRPAAKTTYPVRQNMADSHARYSAAMAAAAARDGKQSGSTGDNMAQAGKQAEPAQPSSMASSSSGASSLPQPKPKATKPKGHIGFMGIALLTVLLTWAALVVACALLYVLFTTPNLAHHLAHMGVGHTLYLVARRTLRQARAAQRSVARALHASLDGRQSDLPSCLQDTAVCTPRSPLSVAVAGLGQRIAPVMNQLSQLRHQD